MLSRSHEIEPKRLCIIERLSRVTNKNAKDKNETSTVRVSVRFFAKVMLNPNDDPWLDTNPNSYAKFGHICPNLRPYLNSLQPYPATYRRLGS